jgi:serine/threonine protein kinase
VLRCYGTDLADGRAGIWTALARGATLADLIREHGRFSEIRAAAIGRTLCHASAALLEAGIPHGDLTPNGVLVDGQGQPIVVDSTLLFGLSERVVASDDLTGPFGSCVAPEIQAGGPHTEASIVYSIGALVHYLTTGIYLDPDDDSPTASNSRGRLWALHAVEPRLSREFVGLLEHATAPRPSDRLHTLDALEHALLLASTRPVGADVAASKPKRRLAAWVAALTRFGRSTGSYRKETDDSD